MHERIQKICVAGAGVMGQQISLNCAMHGYPVILIDQDEEILQKAQNYQETYLKENASANEQEKILQKIHCSTDLEEGTNRADLVIEAIPEKLELKQSLFKQLDGLCPPHTILASVASSIRISMIEDATCRKDKVLNMHFFHLGATLVEIMRGTCTSEETIAKVKYFAQNLGLTPIVLQKESTGFIYNRIWRAIKKEAMKIVDEEVATPEDVDRACMHMWALFEKYLAGPFGYMDHVGLDTVRDIEMIYHRESGDDSDLPPQFLLEKIEKGELGVKTGKGFYTYPNPVYRDPAWLVNCENNDTIAG